MAWDDGLRQYKVWKEYPTGAGYTISPQLVAGLPPLTDYTLDDLRPKFAAALLPLADYTLDDLRRQLQMLRQQERQALFSSRVTMPPSSLTRSTALSSASSANSGTAVSSSRQPARNGRRRVMARSFFARRYV